MRICFLSRADTIHPESGGMETQGKLLTEGLVKAGHDIVVITTAHPEGKEILNIGGVKRLYLAESTPGVDTASWRQKSMVMFEKLHREKKFDLVLSQSVAGWEYLKVKERYQVPCIAIMHGTTFRDIKTRWRSVSSFWDFPRFLKEVVIRLGRFFFRWLYWFRKFDAIIAVSEAVRGSLIKNYFLDPKKIFTVYNGIEVERFANRKQRVVDRKTILYLGRLDKDKGIGTLLEAFSRITNNESRITLLIVGDGPLYNTLVYRTKQWGIENQIKFVGRVPYEETPKYYQAADVFVLPSEALEGLPMTVIEAMASGLPVIASRVGGIPEAVVDDETGILTEPGNVEELSLALSKLLTDEKLRSKIGGRARQVAEEKFSQETMVKKTLMIIRSIVRGGEG